MFEHEGVVGQAGGRSSRAHQWAGQRASQRRGLAGRGGRGAGAHRGRGAGRGCCRGPPRGQVDDFALFLAQLSRRGVVRASQYLKRRYLRIKT